MLSNLRALVALRRQCGSPVRIVASFLLQSSNFREIPLLSRTLLEIGVDVLEIKAQHFDERRGMTSAEIHEAYNLIEDAARRHQHEGYRVVAVQSREEALGKLRKLGAGVPFRRCYANLLGLNGTVDPRGRLQTCCQYHQRTLPDQGDIRDGYGAAWQGDQRLAGLENEPSEFCDCCSPSDEFVNRFVEFVRTAAEQDPTFLDWADSHLATRLA